MISSVGLTAESGACPLVTLRARGPRLATIAASPLAPSSALVLPPDACRIQFAALQPIEIKGHFGSDAAALALPADGPAPPDASCTLLAAPHITETMGHFATGAAAPALSAAPLALAAPSPAMQLSVSCVTQGEIEFPETKDQPDVYAAGPPSHYGTAAAVPKTTADDDAAAALSMPQRLRRILRRTTESIESTETIGQNVTTGYYPAIEGTAI
jgi:hypothetical protein